MRLKILTTSLVIAGIVLLVAWPFLVGERPEASEGKRVVANYALRLLAYFAVTATTWLGAALCAWLLIRQTKLEYLRSLRDNADGLIQGSLHDHEKRPKS